MKSKYSKIYSAIFAGMLLSGSGAFAETLYYTGLTGEPSGTVTYIYKAVNSVAWKTSGGVNQLPVTSGDSLVIDVNKLDSTATVNRYSLAVISPTGSQSFSYSFDNITLSNYYESTKTTGTNAVSTILLAGYTGAYCETYATINSVNVNSGMYSFLSRGFVSNTHGHDLNLTIANDVVVGAKRPADYIQSYDLNGDLSIGGTSRYYTGDTKVGDQTPIKSLAINGNVIIGGASFMALNVGYTNYSGSYNINNPDTIIQGAVAGYGGSYKDSGGNWKTNDILGPHRFSTFYLSNANSSSAVNSVGAVQVIQVGGLSGTITVRNAARNSSGKTLSILVLANTDSYSSGSTFADDAGSGSYATDFCDKSKVRVVMKGSDTGRQAIDSAMAFSGGVEVISGTLAFNVSNASANGYGIRADTSATLFTHGELSMEGGTLELYTSNSNVFNFSVNYFNYDGGTISLNVVNDKITNLSIDKLNDVDVQGGKMLSSNGEARVVEFDFGGETQNLIDTEKKIISWTSYDEDNLTFHADNTFVFGQEYEYVFRAVQGDGLYVQLNTVPEPAAIAAVLGLAALAFAIRRRRA